MMWASLRGSFALILQTKFFMYIKPLLFSGMLLIGALGASAQTPPQMTTRDTSENDEDDLMSMLEEDAPAKQEYISATFKSTRIANGHSIENTAKGILDFRISHRFGVVKNGLEDFFGLDGAATRIGFDYGVTDWLMVGIGRSSLFREYDGFAKVRLLRQTENNRMPVSLSYLGAVSIQATEEAEDYYFSNRVAYVNQVLLARKFSPKFSLQLMPTHIHYNLVQTRDEPNDVLAMGAGGRLKLSNRISLTAEYYYLLPGNKLDNTVNALTIGFDIETGGHVFQLMFSNAATTTERNAIGMTTDKWDDGNVHFGFNISRVFTIVKPKGFENSRNKIW